MRYGGDKTKADAVYAGVEPCTPEDIAEVVVFAAGRRENMVLAEALLFPNHQVSIFYCHNSLHNSSAHAFPGDGDDFA